MNSNLKLFVQLVKLNFIKDRLLAALKLHIGLWADTD